MATIKEQEELIEVLKFTPRTYKVRLWGYGGEYVMGTVDRKAYNYFKARRLDLAEFAWDSDYADKENIPEDMQPFYPGSWHDCDNMGHCWGVDRSAGTLQIDDENGDSLYEKSLEEIDGMGTDGTPPEPEWASDDEVWIDSQPVGQPVFIGVSSEKGTFFEGDLELKAPFNAGKLQLTYTEIDGNEIITKVEYDGVEIENWGGDTTGKSTDFGMYIAGSNKHDGNGWEKYRNMDDINYTLTEWFPKKVNPAREGEYEIKTPGKNSYTYRARWDGTDWYNTWNGEEAIKIKEWRGIAYDPDEHYLRDELDQIAATFPGAFPTAAMLDELEQVECVQCDWKGSVEDTFSNDKDEMICPKCSSPVEFTDSKEETVADNLNPWANSAPTEAKELTWWTVKTLDKKSVLEVEEFCKDGMTLKNINGFRWGTWRVATNDGNPPEFEFDSDGQVDMNSCYSNNIEEVELDSMDDGWYSDLEWSENVSDKEQEKAQEVIDEESVYELESHGWYHSETYVYVSGPLEISDETGEVVKVIND